MALPDNHPLSEVQVTCHTASVAASPIAAYVRAPFRGKILKTFAILGGVITVADAAIATAINAVAITGGDLTIANAGSAAGNFTSAVPTAANDVNEDDVISFTPSGATGTNIPAQFGCVIRRA
jgi:hypothetical protein